MLPRALAIISGVMSTPTTEPVSPTWRAARNASSPATAPEVEHAVAGFQFGNCLRVAAPKAQVRAGGRTAALLFGIAGSLQCRLSGWPAAS